MANTISDRAVSMLITVWMRACHACFPRPSAWASLAEAVRSWRHREQLIGHWVSLITGLTGQLCANLHLAGGPQQQAAMPWSPCLPGM
ncbi:unnamed protein product [Protopolystoma xenopodis]|uniref:Ral GTPase-activating protein subunit alpha/beta N-terminal domain-containing protein n=1 Tax=Protopolystoma xenopodis TaxID=117903 RepID=A0A3S5AEJ8_9PLAT|nr:unnamed protein product [Protopolystoma xenopodis]